MVATLTAYDDELPALYSNGIRAVVYCLTSRQMRQFTSLRALPFNVFRWWTAAAATARGPSVMEELSFSVGRYQTLEELLASRTRALELRVAWRRIRRSAPRCLECGSVKITPLARSQTHSGNDKWTLREHPDCGGIVTVLEQMVLALDRRWLR